MQNNCKCVIICLCNVHYVIPVTRIVNEPSPVLSVNPRIESKAKGAIIL
jgi:hypothetical protein